jgi:hypothetical protein
MCSFAATLRPSAYEHRFDSSLSPPSLLDSPTSNPRPFDTLNDTSSINSELFTAPPVPGLVVSAAPRGGSGNSTLHDADGNTPSSSNTPHPTPAHPQRSSSESTMQTIKCVVVGDGAVGKASCRTREHQQSPDAWLNTDLPADIVYHKQVP